MLPRKAKSNANAVHTNRVARNNTANEPHEDDHMSDVDTDDTIDINSDMDITDSEPDEGEIASIAVPRRQRAIHPPSSGGAPLIHSHPPRCETCYHQKKPEQMIVRSLLPKSCQDCYGDICRECMDIYLERYFLRTDGLSLVIACPACSAKWDMTTVERFVGKSKMNHYMERMTHRSLETNPTFRWCAADKCQSGQYYEQEQVGQAGGEKICCGVCEGEACFKCRSIWHEGLSCEEYQDPDLRKHRGKRAVDVEVRKAMRKGETKRCPNCGSAIERTSGCNHVYCKFRLVMINQTAPYFVEPKANIWLYRYFLRTSL